MCDADPATNTTEKQFSSSPPLARRCRWTRLARQQAGEGLVGGGASSSCSTRLSLLRRRRPAAAGNRSSRRFGFSPPQKRASLSQKPVSDARANQMAENIGSAKYNTFISSDSPCFKKAEYQRHWKGVVQGWVLFKRKVFFKTVWEQKWMVLGKKVYARRRRELLL